MSIIMLTVATLAGEPALADGPEIGQDAGAFFPLENDSIQLVAEEVEIYLPSSLTNPVGPAGLRHGLAKCTYHLRNLTATAQEFAMAFVIQGPAPSWMQTDANFRVEMSGEELPVRYVPLDKARWEGLLHEPPDSLPAWAVRIPPKATVDLLMTYDVIWSGSSGGLNFSFRAKAAALWAGRIERAEIEFFMDDMTAYLLWCQSVFGACIRMIVEPEGFQWTSRGVKWSFTDWEPAEDFRLALVWRPLK